MLGRIIIPISFTVEGREVKVREISEFKKYFNNNHLKELLKALHDGKLEQFFYAHGRDEIKDLIVELKKNSTPDIEILNKIAEKLGLERFQIQGKDDFAIVSREKDIREIFEENAKELHLTSGSWRAIKEDICYKNEKNIKGDGKNKTFILLQDLSLTGKTDQWLIFENLTIASEAEHGTLIIKNAKVRFDRVRLSNLSIKTENAEIELIATDSDSEKPIAIEVNKGVLNIKNCKNLVFNGSVKITSGNLLFTDSELKYTGDEYLFNLINVKAQGINSQIAGGMILDSSLFVAQNTSILKSKLSGIYCKKGKLFIKDSSIYENNENAIKAEENSEVVLEKAEVYRNGKENYPQLWIENSKCQIIDSKIYEGRGTGIYSSNSSLTITNSQVFENAYHAIKAEENSEVVLEKAEVYRNGNENYGQIWIENSKCQIIDSKIYEGRGTGIYCTISFLTVNHCEVYKNSHGGIEIYSDCNVEIYDTCIYDNGDDDYCDGIGIYRDSSKVKMKKVVIWGNKWGLIWNNIENITTESCEFKDGVTSNTNCFITSSVLYAIGKGDNCYELNAFRSFRDNWLRHQPDGETLIEEYYAIAPVIVREIDKRENKRNIYKELWEVYLYPCLKLLEEGKFKEVKDKYTEMVEMLKLRFLN